ncbi:hypothetical protein JXC34_07270 [Candidatus Woesearchaeota archaeon]|nr:hypothetical protein [Candidatus Woesearchaeota archaeon]
MPKADRIGVNEDLFSRILEAETLVSGNAGIPTEKIEFGVEFTSRIFARYKRAAIKDGLDFPTEQIDESIFAGLSPMEMALVHYIASQQYDLPSGRTLPFAISWHDHDAANFIVEYLYEHVPNDLGSYLNTRLTNAIEEQRRLINDLGYMEKKVKEMMEGQAMAGSYMSPEERREVVYWDEKQWKNDFLQKISVEIERLGSLRDNPVESLEYSAEVIDAVRIGVKISVGNFGSPSRLTHIDTWLNPPLKEELYAISDRYRIVPEHKLENYGLKQKRY